MAVEQHVVDRSEDMVERERKKLENLQRMQKQELKHMLLAEITRQNRMHMQAEKLAALEKHARQLSEWKRKQNYELQKLNKQKIVDRRKQMEEENQREREYHLLKNEEQAAIEEDNKMKDVSVHTYN